MEDFKFRKSLGQNFINDDNIISKIVKYSDVDKDTLVIEIGPGAGSLSKQIIPKCGYAILYEIDTRLKDILNSVLNGNNNYEIVFDDFLNQNLVTIKNKCSNYKKVYVVANLPYYITTPIITKLLKELYPDKIIIMVQDEVADRLCAKSGSREYGMISVLLGAKYDMKKLFKVSRNCFTPAPNVDSAVIEMVKNNKVDNSLYDKLEKFVKLAFRFKRKNLRNNLREYDLDMLDKVLFKHGYSLLNRAEDISVDKYIEIVKEI